MSVRSTLIAILVVAFAAFGVIAWTHYTTINEFENVQDRTAASAEELVLYLDLTVCVNRYVKEALEEVREDQGKELEEAKKSTFAKLDGLDRAAETAKAAGEPPDHIADMRERTATLRSYFLAIVQAVEVADANHGKEGAAEKLDDAIEQHYDHEFLALVDKVIADERGFARESESDADKLADRVEATSLGVVIVSLTALVGLVLVVSMRIRSLTQSIKTLLAGAERIAAGDLQQRVPDLGKNEIGLIGSAFNKMADGLVEAQDEKVRAERLAAVGQAAASVGHDLRNPLGAIRNATHYLKRRVTEVELGSNPRVMQFFDIINKELDASTKIIGNLLDYARERRLTVSAFPLRPLVEEAVSVAGKAATMRVDIDVPDTLPVLNLDRDQIRQALVNLVQNACEAVPEERDGHVVISATAEGEMVKLSIKDNGDGISEEQRAQIFEPFFTTKTKGTGLGLAITLSVIDRHGGSIDIQSEKGVGTTFFVTLPVAGKPADDSGSHSQKNSGDMKS